MGKGDKKSRRGKIWRGTFGVLRRPSGGKGDLSSKKINESTKADQA